MNRRKTEFIGTVEPRMLDVSGLCIYLNMGRNRAVEFARDIGAEKRIGRRCLYDKRTLDRALDELTEA